MVSATVRCLVNMVTIWRHTGIYWPWTAMDQDTIGSPGTSPAGHSLITAIIRTLYSALLFTRQPDQIPKLSKGAYHRQHGRCITMVSFLIGCIFPKVSISWNPYTNTNLHTPELVVQCREYYSIIQRWIIALVSDWGATCGHGGDYWDGSHAPSAVQ